MTSMSAIKTTMLGAALSLSLVVVPAMAQRDMTAPAVAGTHQVQAQHVQQTAGSKKAARKAAPKKVPGKQATGKQASGKKVAKKQVKPTKVAKHSRKTTSDKHHGAPTHRTSTAVSKASVKHAASPHRG